MFVSNILLIKFKITLKFNDLQSIYLNIFASEPFSHKFNF